MNKFNKCWYLPSVVNFYMDLSLVWFYFLFFYYFKWSQCKESTYSKSLKLSMFMHIFESSYTTVKLNMQWSDFDMTISNSLLLAFMIILNNNEMTTVKGEIFFSKALKAHLSYFYIPIGRVCISGATIYNWSFSNLPFLPKKV